MVYVTLASSADATVCAGCGLPRKFCGPPINEYYCDNCDYDRVAMQRGVREITSQLLGQNVWQIIRDAPTTPAPGASRGPKLVGIDASGTVAVTYHVRGHRLGTGWVREAGDELRRWEPVWWANHPDPKIK